MIKFLIFLTVILYINALPFQRLQSAGAKGKLMCKGKPYENAKIKLYDVDFGLPDDLMGQTKTSSDGTFHVAGKTSELTDIDPKVNIYHNCEDETKECLRKIEIIIPKKDYVFEGGTPSKIFDVGIINLSGKYSGESRDCFN